MISPYIVIDINPVTFGYMMCACLHVLFACMYVQYACLQRVNLHVVYSCHQCVHMYTYVRTVCVSLYECTHIQDVFDVCVRVYICILISGNIKETDISHVCLRSPDVTID